MEGRPNRDLHLFLSFLALGLGGFLMGTIGIVSCWLKSESVRRPGELAGDRRRSRWQGVLEWLVT